MIKFDGQIENVIFENSNNLFKIINVKILSKIPNWVLETITVTGTFGNLDLDVTYEFEGEIVNHEKFGKQFRCTSYQEVLPTEATGLIKYLSGDNFVGIGEKTAATIVQSLGNDAIDTIKENPDIVNTLDISGKQKKVLAEQISAMDSFSDQILAMTKLGIQKKIATKIYQVFREESLTKIKKNPYRIINDVNGFGFITADEVGKNLGFLFDSPERIQGAILHALEADLAQTGNTYLLNDELLLRTQKILDNDLNPAVDFEKIVLELNKLQSDQLVIIDHNRAYLSEIFSLEFKIADELKEIVDKTTTDSDNDEKQTTKIENVLAKVQEKLNIHYDGTQLKAIKSAVLNPVSILTGGPGTGKTTIIAGILMTLKLLKDYSDDEIYGKNSPFLLAAPTGRAAKRMNESTNINASTIHRLLGLGHGNQAINDELNEISGEILIVDEMSMVDMYLFQLLIGQITDVKHIVFVGDKDQLPSVGAGNIFSDLINSEILPTTKLTQIHRQSEESSIIELAHQINQGKFAEIFTKTKNTSFIPCSPQQIPSVVGQITKKAIQSGFADDDIQILGAMYRSESGVNNLNEVLQSILNPIEESKKITSIEQNGQKFSVNDRVLQLVNNPEKDIYNGQIGKIVNIDLHDNSQTMIVDFDGREVKISKIEVNDLTLAYAITIHKAQGSEFKLVILALTMQNSRMLQKNLLYTAVTRAEQSLVMIGEKQAYEKAVTNVGSNRLTSLVERIKTIFNRDQEVNSDEIKSYRLTKELIMTNAIDPLIGMH